MQGSLHNLFLNFRKAHEQLFELAQLVMAGMSSGNELQKNEALEHLIFLAENKVEIKFS